MYFLYFFEFDIEYFLNIIVVVFVLEELALVDEVDHFELAVVGNEDSIVGGDALFADDLALEGIHFLEHEEYFVLELDAEFIVIKKALKVLHQERALLPVLLANTTEVGLHFSQVNLYYDRVQLGLHAARRSKSI